jgi:uncharacterized protein (DUF1810 family)
MDVRDRRADRVPVCHCFVMADPFDLQRFLDVQVGLYDRALAELRVGAKSTHWGWLVFPQTKKQSTSPVAARFGIDSLAEAKAYIAHPVLGERLRECSRILVSFESGVIQDFFEYPECLRVHASMTLFVLATDDNTEFKAVLDKYFGGELDSVTRGVLGL